MSKQEIRRIYRTALKEDFPQILRLELGGKVFEYSKVHWTIGGENRGLRYGTNPHQKAALYRAERSKGGIGNVEWIKWGKDGPSATNIEDGSHGLRIVRYFHEPAVAVMKHLNPSGVSVGQKGEALFSVYARARDSDPRAAFGSVVVLNRRVDKSTAEELSKTFVEVVYAPDYEGSAISVFQAKKDIRIGKVKFPDGDSQSPDIVVLEDGSLILEDFYRTGLGSLEQLRMLPVATKRSPSDTEYRAMLHSWWVACEVRSNAVVFWKNEASLAIGTGQQDRIGAIESCIEKAHKFSHDLTGSVMASDGFLPNIDNVEAVAKEGVSGIVQPGGSVEDQALIRACDQHGIAMVMTGERSFRHF
jgi:phosphoribosylaminoimidazolecarboxamide formyltransferase / IMP cyclohydrolase